MKRLAMTFGLPILILLGTVAWYAWPQPPAWAVFEVPVTGKIDGPWIAEGLQSLEECESFVRSVIQLSGSDMETGHGLVCGFGCTFLRSRPQLTYCESVGDIHEPD